MNKIMKSFYEQIGGTYSKNETGHLIPNLSYAPAEQFPIGVWGQWRKKYLKEYHRGLYYELYQHLSVIDEQAQERYDMIVTQMKKHRESLSSLNLKINLSGFRK